MNVKVLIITVIVLILAWDGLVLLFGIKQTPPWALKSALHSETPPLLIDVRTPQEFRAFHIPGAINIPAPALPPQPILDQMRTRHAVIICMTGHRSPIMAWRLKRHGAANASNLTWGMAGWLLSGGKTASGEGHEGVKQSGTKK
jgi:rhodanese-related sulfurtransferase